MLVVDGRDCSTTPSRGIWHFSVWTLVGDELPHSGANVIVDVTDESAPMRYFYDYCALPPSFGERRASSASTVRRAVTGATIRPETPEDADAVRGLHLAAFGEHGHAVNAIAL